MSTALAEGQGGALQPVEYAITEAELATLREQCAALTADTREGYEAVRVKIGELVSVRTAIEARRVELKAPHLERGRLIDEAANKLKGIIGEIEDPLRAKKKDADAERERLRREAAEAELVATEARLKAEREAEEARLKAEREAEEKRLADERAAHAAERATFEAQRAAADKQRAEEQAKIDAQRAAIEARERAVAEEKARLAREHEERQAAAKAEAEAKADVERQRIATEEAARAAAEEAARLEALRPEIERVRAWGTYLRTMAQESTPDVETRDGVMAVGWARAEIERVAAAIEKFTPRRGGS